MTAVQRRILVCVAVAWATFAVVAVTVIGPRLDAAERRDRDRQARIVAEYVEAVLEGER